MRYLLLALPGGLLVLIAIALYQRRALRVSPRWLDAQYRYEVSKSAEYEGVSSRWPWAV
jgi:hypothetical protein